MFEEMNLQKKKSKVAYSGTITVGPGRFEYIDVGMLTRVLESIESVAKVDDISMENGMITLKYTITESMETSANSHIQEMVEQTWRNVQVNHPPVSLCGSMEDHSSYDGKQHDVQVEAYESM